MPLLDALLPVDCAGCGAPGHLVCRRCRQQLDRPARPAWPAPAPPALPCPWSVLAYDGVARALVLAYKERGAVGLSRVLAMPLAAAIRAAAGPAGGVVVVPVPSSRAAIRDRGDDVTDLVVRRAVARVRREGGRVRVVRALAQVRRVADSAGLDAASRAANLAGAFAVRPGAPRAIGATAVVIADDVITTGTTIAEAARALRVAGVRVQAAATIAATQRRAPPAAWRCLTIGE